MKKNISIVIPCFNEGEAVRPCYNRLVQALYPIEQECVFSFLFVDDGSSDSTLPELLKLSKQDCRVAVLELSRNFGKEAALTAGIYNATGDAVIPIDADLQDPPELIPSMVREWQKGAEVVLARRSNRDADSFLKRKTAELFYRFHNAIAKPAIPHDVGDFRLMDRVVVDALKQLGERQRFMKGLFAWVGFKSVTVNYVREKRSAGKTKFSFWKLWNLALDGLTGFSTTPLRIWSYVGGFGVAFAGSYILFIVCRTLWIGVDVPGYASLLVATLFFASIQLLSIGLLGEYIGRMYFETKQRPIYIIRRRHGSEGDAS